MNLNAQSLKNKMAEFNLTVKNKNPQIISITESWGKDWVKDGIFELDGYTMYRNDRKGAKGGGTILYINNKIEQRACRPLSSKEFESSSWCWINETGGKKILVGSIYRSTSSSQNNNDLLLELLDKACEIAGDNRLLILGDFNIPKVDWANRITLDGAKPIDDKVLEKANDNFLFQHVKQDTRFRNNESSLLDLVFTKEEEDVKNIEILQPLGNSDHGIVVGDFVCEWKSRIVRKPRRQYHLGNYEKIEEGLNKIDWLEEFRNKNVQECWNIFKSKLESLIDEHIPMSEPKDYNEPWMNWKLIRIWRRKYFAWKRYTECKNFLRYREYRKDANRLSSESRKAKRAFEKSLAMNIRDNKRAFFRYVNSKLTVRPEIVEMRDENGTLFDNDKDICNILGRYFNSVYSNVPDDEMPPMDALCNSQISDIEICLEDVKSRLEKLNVNKSCGPDSMHPLVLKKTASTICIPLEMIYKLSLVTKQCPDDWRSANVTPIHKKGDRADPSNYRPVSLTSQVCKILESIVRSHILKHLAENNILRNEQHGFREGRSCLTNLLEIVEKWTKILDDGDFIDVAYLDFSKAFDLVSHKHLIYKMSKYGITNQVLEWVEAFLSQRSQRVVIRGTASESFAVTSGVPQGSVLGPVLFLIYINDLPLEIISPLSLFADDSKIFTKIISEKNRKENSIKGNEVLQNDLEAIKSWADKWKMSFNIDKCKVMHLGSKNPKHVYSMGGRNLMDTTTEKDLGVLFDSELEFDQHIRGLVNKANRMLGMIKLGFACMDKQIFMNLYPVLVRPLLEYCVQVWSPYKRKHIDLLEGVQRRATKLVPEIRGKSYEERLAFLGLTTLEDRRVRGDMIETYKILSGKEDVNPDTFFQMAQIRGDPALRNTLKLGKRGAKGDKRKYTFSYRVVDKWNSLSKSEFNAKKTSGFKSAYDKNEAERKKAREDYPYVSGVRYYTLRVKPPSLPSN